MGLIIKLCQLIKPFLIQFYIAVLLQSMDQLLYRRSLSSQNQIAQNVLSGVFRSQLTKFPVIILCLIRTSFFNCQLGQLVQKALSHRGPFKSQKENILCFLIFSIFFINPGNHRQDIDIANSSPVNGIRDLHRCLKIF